MEYIKKSKMFVLLVIVSLIIGYLVYVQLNVTFLGISVYKDNSGRWLIDEINTEGWAEKHGIRVGDQIIRIDGQLPEQHFNIKLLSIGNINTLQTERNGQSYFFNVPQKSNLPISIQLTIAPICLFVIIMLFSLFLLLKKPEDPAAKLLVLFFLSVAVSYACAGASGRRDIAGMFLLMGGIIQVPNLFLHFLYRYFKQMGLAIINFKFIVVLYILNAVSFGINCLFLFTDIGFTIPYHLYSDATLLLFAVGIIFGICILMFNYIKYRKTLYKPLFKYMLLGNFLSFFPFVFLYAIPYSIFNQWIISPGIAAMFLLALPIIYVYLIASDYLMDIDFVLNRARYYSFLAIIPAIVIVPIVSLLFQSKQQVFIQWIQAFLIVYGGIILFLYTKDTIDFRFRKKIFKGAYHFQASLDRFASQIGKIMKVADLEERLMKEVLDMLPTKSVALLEMNISDGTVTLNHCHGLQQGDEPDLLRELKLYIGEYRIGDFIRVKSGLFCIVSKINHGYKLIWIGSKENRVQFNQDELMWLQTILNYVNMVFENLQLIEGVIMDLEIRSNGKAPSWVLRLLFQLTEKERRRLAADLHDSALQDQLLWYRKLEMILDEVDLSDEVRDSLVQIKEGLLDVVHQIRETCNELRPPFLKEMGVVEAIDNLRTYAEFHSNYSVDFNHDGFDWQLDDEYVLTIYRITQELLRNTMKHARATEVKIQLSKQNNIIVYSYEDNGIGMDLEQLRSSFNHMGLSGLRERVAGLEGETMFDSAVGGGFKVKIFLPYQPVASTNFAVAAREVVHD